MTADLHKKISSEGGSSTKKRFGKEIFRMLNLYRWGKISKKEFDQFIAKAKKKNHERSN